MKNNFFTFEGIDGSGKTTVIQAVYEKLSQKHDVVISREPGGVETAENIRDLILSKKNENADGLTNVMLFAASRNEHIKKKIIPARKGGKIIIVDRYVDSSYAYQGFGQEIGFNIVKQVNESVVKNNYPCRTFLLKIDLATSMERKKSDTRDNNHLDEKSIEFYERVIEGYDFLASEYRKRYYVIDATKSIEEISDEIIVEIEKCLNT
jgi:dTMP kinase